MVESKDPWLWKFIIGKDSLLGLLNLNISHGEICITYNVHTFKKWDSFGILHSQGMCVLLEVQRVVHSTEYFEILHPTSSGIFELSGANCNLCKFNIPQPATLVMTARTIWPQMRLKDLLVFWNVVALYHFIVVLFQQLNLSCSFWKRVTLNAICDHRRKYFQTYQADCESVPFLKSYSNSLHFIYYVDINIAFKLQKDGRCCLLGVQMVN